MAEPAEFGQGDDVILHGRIVHLRNGVARVQVCRQLVYCLTDELEPEAKAMTHAPETRAMTGPAKSKAAR